MSILSWCGCGSTSAAAPHATPSPYVILYEVDEDGVGCENWISNAF